MSLAQLREFSGEELQEYIDGESDVTSASEEVTLVSSTRTRIALLREVFGQWHWTLLLRRRIWQRNCGKGKGNAYRRRAGSVG